MSQSFRFTGARRFKPRLQDIEDTTINIRKMLRQLQGRNGPWRFSVQVTDAIAMCESIEGLCLFGKDASAEDAKVVLDLVEELVEHLCEAIHDVVVGHARRV